MAAGSRVSDRFEDAQALSEIAFNTALQFLSDLRNAVTDFSALTVDDINVDTESLSIPNIVAEVPDISTIDDVGDLDLPTSTFDFSEDAYTSSLLEEIQSLILTDLEDDSSLGISTDTKDAMIAWETEKDDLIRQDAQDDIASIWSKRGLDLPDGVLAHGLRRTETEYQNKRLDKTRQITEEDVKLAIENKRHRIEKGLALEHVLMTYNGGYWERKLNAARAVLEAGITIFNAYVQKVLAQAEIQKAKAAVYEATVKASAAAADVQIRVVEARVRIAVSSAEIQIKRLALAIEQAKAIADLGIEASKAGGQIASTLAAGALAGISAIASISESVSESTSSSFTTYDDITSD